MDVRHLQNEHKRAGRGQIHVVNDGIEALRYLQGSPPYDDRRQYPSPNTLLLDLSLPLLSGMELLAAIRAHADNHIRATRVILISIAFYPPDVKRAIELGISGYLVKPVLWEQIANLLQQNCAKTAGGQEIK